MRTQQVIPGRRMRTLGLALAALSKSAAAIPGEQTEQTLLTSFLLTSTLLAVLLVLGYVVLRWLRHGQAAGWRKGSPFKFHASFPLGTRERIVLIEVTGRFLVLGVTPQRIDLLLELPEFLSAQAAAERRPSEIDSRRE
jgi:flagellar protein FliO/FliZ